MAHKSGAISPEALKRAFENYFKIFSPEEIRQRVQRGLEETELHLAQQEKEVQEGKRFPRS